MWDTNLVLRINCVVTVCFFGLMVQGQDVEPGGPPEHRAIHVVLCWLNEPGDQHGITTLLKTSSELAEIPGLLEIRAGTSISSDRPIVDSSFDVAFVMVFSSKSTMQEYLSHPKHREAVKDVLGPLVKRILVYDCFEEVVISHSDTSK